MRSAWTVKTRCLNSKLFVGVQRSEIKKETEKNKKEMKKAKKKRKNKKEKKKQEKKKKNSTNIFMTIRIRYYKIQPLQL